MDSVPTSGTFTLQIYSIASNGRPRDLIYTLTNPATFNRNAVNIFAAPTNATLAANTTYATVATLIDGGILVTATNSSDEDSNAVNGWTRIPWMT